jgi:hypothetical protein
LKLIAPFQAAFDTLMRGANPLFIGNAENLFDFVFDATGPAQSLWENF